MAQTKAIVNKLLTNASKAFFPTGFIAENILPKIMVKQASGTLAGYTNHHLRIINSVMGGRGKAPRIEGVVRTQSDSYQIINHGLEGLVTKDDYDNVEAPYDAEKDEMIGIKTMLAISREKAIADSLTSTSVLTQNTTLSGQSQFSDYTNSDPLGKFKDARLAVKDGCGVAPDTAIMSWEVADTLQFHPGILESLGFAMNRAGQLTYDELAKALKVRRLLVADASYNTAKEGQADSLAPIWGKHIIFGVMPQSAQKYQVSLGYTIRKTGEVAGTVYKYPENNPPESNVILVTDNYDDLLSNVKAAYLIKNAVA